MNIQTGFRALSSAELSQPRCPRCGSVVLMAERAAFNPDGCIRHTWSCDDCSHEFVTSIRMRGRQPRRNVAS
jgi:ribosomal protein S27AE